MGIILYKRPSEAISIVSFNSFVTLTRVRGIDHQVRSLNDCTSLARQYAKIAQRQKRRGSSPLHTWSTGVAFAKSIKQIEHEYLQDLLSTLRYNALKTDIGLHGLGISAPPFPVSA